MYKGTTKLPQRHSRQEAYPAVLITLAAEMRAAQGNWQGIGVETACGLELEPLTDTLRIMRHLTLCKVVCHLKVFDFLEQCFVTNSDVAAEI